MTRRSRTYRAAILGLALLMPYRASAQSRFEAVRSTLRTAAAVSGGALVGGFLGYFLAQVRRSDWDQQPTAGQGDTRRTYTIAGASLGAVAGYFVRPRPRPRMDGVPPSRVVSPRVGRQLLDSSDLSRSIATNALEAVELERPEWIRGIRVAPADSGPAGVASAPLEATTVVVYVGDDRVGGLQTLREMSIPEIRELRFFDPADARRRWGSDHPHGAIEVVPARNSARGEAERTSSVLATPGGISGG